MDRETQDDILDRLSSDRGKYSSPEERAVVARARFLRAASGCSLIPSFLSDSAKRAPISWTLVALAGGFLAGFSPSFRRTVLESAAPLLRAWLSLKR